MGSGREERECTKPVTYLKCHICEITTENEIAKIAANYK